MASIPEQTTLPPELRESSFWFVNRRPLYLAILSIGLVLFLLRLPVGVRASNLFALNVQRGLLLLHILFGAVTLPLVWFAGQRLDTRVFMLFNLQHYPRDVIAGLVLGSSWASCDVGGPRLVSFTFERASPNWRRTTLLSRRMWLWSVMYMMN